MAIEVAEGISGSLNETTLPDLLRILAWNGRSGALLLWDGPAQIGLSFDQGRIARAQTTEPLGAAVAETLLLDGHVSRRAFEQARAALPPSPRHLGRVLRLLSAEGEIAPTGLVALQEAMIREVMRQALTWSHGDLQFKPNVPPLPPVGLADLPVEQVLIDGLRALDEHNHVTVTGQTVVRWAPAPPPGLTALKIGPLRWKTLGACNGKRTVAEVAAALDWELPIVVERVQWLLDHGAVLPVESAPAPPAPTAPPSPGMEDQIVLLLSRFETTWPTGRVAPARAAAALARMSNAVARAYLEFWQELTPPPARQRLWRALLLHDLERLPVFDDAPFPVATDRNALRDGQVIAPRALPHLQTLAEQEPAATLHALLRLLERALLLLVGEIERPVAQVDSFESVNVFVRELNHRLVGRA